MLHTGESNRGEEMRATMNRQHARDAPREQKLLENVPELALLRMTFPEGVLLILGMPADNRGIWSIAAAVSTERWRVVGTGRHKNVHTAAKRAINEATGKAGDRHKELGQPLGLVRTNEPLKVAWAIRERRGRISEQRVLETLRKAGHPIPDFVLSAHPAKPEEDERGIDVVVRTVDGREIWIQVKSNQDDVADFRKLHPDPRIMVCVVNRHTLESKLRRSLRGLLNCAYHCLPKSDGPKAPAR